MNKLARLPTIDGRADPEGSASEVPRLRTRYYAFLSYSHKDRELADWLHRELERFRVPTSLAGKLTANGVVPRRLTPVFRDQHDLSAGGDLAIEIEAALAASQFLVVLCSPTAATSRWTNLEIEAFKRTRPEGCVLAAVVAGEPFASDIPGREDEECFPPALRYKYDRRGHRTAKRAEPLAADFREGGDGRRIAFLKLVAGMLGVGLDELVQRETTRRQRRLAMLAAASLGGMAITSTLAVTAIQARDAAREQRRQAENLVEFMLGDLKDKLEPIGKLDVLDGVGTRVLDYYSKQDTKQLSDVGLAQRSEALTLMGQIARDRGELDRADALYRQAYAGSAEEVARDPNDPQRLYDHAQNVFYLAEIAYKRGQFSDAESDFREYRRLADRMVALDPDNMKWRMEVQDAAVNLGLILYSRRDFADSVEQFQHALDTIQALATAEPSNATYQQNVSATLALLSPAQEADGKLSEATQTQKRYVDLLQRLLPQKGADAVFQMIPGYRELGRLYAEQGQSALALQQFRAATERGESLVASDPTNQKWRESTVQAKLMLARELIAEGDTTSPDSQVQPICNTYAAMVAKDPKVAIRAAGLRDCLMLSAEVAARAGQKDRAISLASLAVQKARAVKTLDRASDAFGVARALRLWGDARRDSGDRAGAEAAWTASLRAIPGGVAEMPSEIDEHATILERLGRADEARALRARLDQMGYRKGGAGAI